MKKEMPAFMMKAKPGDKKPAGKTAPPFGKKAAPAKKGANPFAKMKK